jgi:hypothetical protein
MSFKDHRVQPSTPPYSGAATMRALVRAAPPLRSIAHPSRQDFTTKAVSAALGAGNPARSRGSGGRQQQQQQHRRSTAPRGNEEQRGEPPRRNRGNNWSSEDSYGGSNWEDKDRDDDSERQMRCDKIGARSSQSYAGCRACSKNRSQQLTIACFAAPLYVKYCL